jgi:hypothetical protein
MTATMTSLHPGVAQASLAAQVTYEVALRKLQADEPLPRPRQDACTRPLAFPTRREKAQPRWR